MIMWESDPRNGAKGFGVSFLFGFSLSLIQYVLFILLFLLEWKYSMPLYLKYVMCLRSWGES